MPPLPPTTRAAPVRPAKSVVIEGSSADAEVDGVPPGRAFGIDVLLLADLDLSLAVRRPHPDHVVTGLDRRGGRPLHPGVLAGHPGQLRRLPVLLVDRELDR